MINKSRLYLEIKYQRLLFVTENYILKNTYLPGDFRPRATKQASLCILLSFVQSLTDHSPSVKDMIQADYLQAPKFHSQDLSKASSIALELIL